VAGLLAGIRLTGLAVDYADATAASNMVTIRLVDFEFAQSADGIVNARAKLEIGNPARGQVNLTYVAYQLILQGGFVAGGSRVFSPNQLVLKPLQAAPLELALNVPEDKAQEVLNAPTDAFQLLIYLTTRTKYGVGTLSFVLSP